MSTRTSKATTAPLDPSNSQSTTLPLPPSVCVFVPP